MVAASTPKIRVLIFNSHLLPRLAVGCVGATQHRQDSPRQGDVESTSQGFAQTILTSLTNEVEDLVNVALKIYTEGMSMQYSVTEYMFESSKPWYNEQIGSAWCTPNRDEGGLTPTK